MRLLPVLLLASLSLTALPVSADAIPEEEVEEKVECVPTEVLADNDPIWTWPVGPKLVEIARCMEFELACLSQPLYAQDPDDTIGHGDERWDDCIEPIYDPPCLGVACDIVCHPGDAWPGSGDVFATGFCAETWYYKDEDGARHLGYRWGHPMMAGDCSAEYIVGTLYVEWRSGCGLQWCRQGIYVHDSWNGHGLPAHFERECVY